MGKIHRKNSRKDIRMKKRKEIIITEKVVFGFPDYTVKTDGSVYNKHGKRLQQYKKDKYMSVYLYRNKKRYYKTIHRIVAETFIPNPKNLPEINHKDENPGNNNVENLEWCDRIYNANYGTLKQRQRERGIHNNPFQNKHHSLETKQKISIKKKGQPSKRKREIYINGIKYESVTKAMQLLNISTKKLYKIIKE